MQNLLLYINLCKQSEDYDFAFGKFYDMIENKKENVIESIYKEKF